MVRGLVLVIASIACGNAKTQAQKDPPQAAKEEPRAMADAPKSEDGVLAVTYSRDFGPMGSEVVYVAREGDSVFSLGTNHQGGAEIGQWRHALEPARLDELLRRLRTLEAKGIEPRGMLRPGESSVTISEWRAVDKPPMMKSYAPGLPELAEVSAFLSEVTAELRRHPARVLRGEARWRSSALSIGQGGEVEVKLSNAGTLPLQTPNPYLRVGFLRPNGEGAGQVDLGDVRPQEGPPAGPMLVLAPGQRVTYVARVKPPIKPGRYDSRVQVIGAAVGPMSEELVHGTLTLDLGRVEVGK
jgi:hypothetical protein